MGLLGFLCVFAVVLGVCQRTYSLRTSAEQIEALQEIYDSTGGSKWDWGQLVSPTGEKWSFERDASNVYKLDPCGDTETGNTNLFAGLRCFCSSTSCQVTNVNLKNGNLKGNLPSRKIGGLKSLQHLYFDNNTISGTLPTSIQNLVSLTELTISHNSVTGSIPTEIGSMANLAKIDLSYNPLTGAIPSELRLLKNLTLLSLTHNDHTGQIPVELLELQNLIYLGLAANKLTGPMIDPAALPGIRAFDISRNALSGTIPDQIGGAKSLTMLNAGYNKLSGTIPSSLGGISKLKQLFFGSNSLTGTLPESLKSLTSLKYMHFYNNKLSGTIPNSYAKLTKMSDFKVFENELTGTIPYAFSQWSDLRYFQVENNHFTGSPDIFDELNMLELEVIDIGNNAFTGPLPSDTFLLPSLRIYAAPENCFSGSIPDTVCKPDKIEVLILSDLTSGHACRKYFFGENSVFDAFTGAHTLEGSIPPCLYEKDHLQHLYLSGNGLKGSLPEKISKNISELDLSDNLITGTIGTDIAQSEQMYILHLQDNKIGGTLDAFKGSKQYQKYDLMLKQNALSGTIPEKLFGSDKIAMVQGNTFECSGAATVPVNDPYREKYICGASAFDFQVSAFSFLLFLLAAYFAYLWWKGKSVEKTHWAYKFPRRLKYWWRVGRPLRGQGIYYATVKETIGKEFGEMKRVVTHFNTLRYCEYYESLRYMCIRMGVILSGLLIIYISMSGESYRTLTYAYLWKSTAAYFKGNVATGVLCVFWIGVLFAIRYFILEDYFRCKELKQKFKEELVESNKMLSKQNAVDHDALDKLIAHNQTDSKIERVEHVVEDVIKDIVMPILRLFIITSLSILVVGSCNVGYVYTLLYKSQQVQLMANIGLVTFNLTWQMYIMPFIFWWWPFHLGVDEKIHDNFIEKYLGGKIEVLFIFQVLFMFFLPIAAVVVTDGSCFNGALFAPDPLTTVYSVPECTDWCLNCEDVNTETCLENDKLEVDVVTVQPFEYHHTCASQVIKAYVPIFISGQLIFGAKIIVYLAIILYEVIWQEGEADSLREENESNEQRKNKLQKTKTQRELEKAEITSTVFWNNEFSDEKKKELIQKHKEDYPLSWFRKTIDLCLPTCPGGELFLFRHNARHLFWLYYNKIYDDRTWLEIIVPVHMGSLLILFTYGVFAPLLGIGIIVAMCMESVIAQILAGRFIAMNSSILTTAYKSKQGEEKIDVKAMIKREEEEAKNAGGSAADTGAMKHAPAPLLTHNFLCAVAEYDEPFGAVSCFELAEQELSIMPKSGILNAGRRPFLWFTAIVFAFTINDIYYALPTATTNYAAPLTVLLLVPTFDMIKSVLGHYRVFDNGSNRDDDDSGEAPRTTETISPLAAPTSSEQVTTSSRLPFTNEPSSSSSIHVTSSDNSAQL